MTIDRHCSYVCCGKAPAEENPLRRRPPHRKHFYSWVPTDRTQLEVAEQHVLRGLHYYQTTIAGLNTIATEDIRALADNEAAAAAMVDSSGQSGTMSSHEDTDGLTCALSPNTVKPPNATKPKEVLVLIHGFAGGVAGWAQNWQYLSERYRVYAFDLPGFARSERKAHHATSVQEAMDFTCGYLERWFARLHFSEPVIILAHSFGCFVAAHYAMRRGPEQVKLLCLTEPWGMRRADPQRIKTYPLLVRMLLPVFYRVSPLGLLRGVGPVGPSLLRRARPDFEAKWVAFLEDTSFMYDYLYHCNAQKAPVGEMLFQACCHYDVCAKEPLPDVLPTQLDQRIRVALLFGEESWMAPKEALEMSTAMLETGFHVLADTLPKAGHQIFTDNVAGFNEKVVEMITALEAEPEKL